MNDEACNYADRGALGKDFFSIEVIRITNMDDLTGELARQLVDGVMSCARFHVTERRPRTSHQSSNDHRRRPQTFVSQAIIVTSLSWSLHTFFSAPRMGNGVG